ncbi:GHMP kinase [Thecamonas trahens ATCC 50062]|uniref:GHMP kinase n=1 Tax=Thecamonas trahens ATCC 50062 TaxID=461836 RepID=A0A0L0D3K1_THETB|nr:GHMP kinase [Thecamonas trahens ATCC 50062]KNC46907.1 GHMP kinase [Thecamonas trahens ATCC 50062]|eukprot:XP_013760180.1 GHMP kinase [Thecamonas trahens ATCC 50062]
MTIRITSQLPDGTEVEVEAESEDALRALAANRDNKLCYAAGAAAEVVARREWAEAGAARQLTSVEIAVSVAGLPLGKGLSSSAALCVLVVKALAAAAAVDWPPTLVMAIAHAGELAAGSPCGLLDQIAPAHGPGAYRVGFGGEGKVTVERVVVGGQIALVVIDLGAAKDTRAILEGLQQAYPNAQSAADCALHALLSDKARAFVAAAGDALVGGDARRLGKVLVEAQQAFDEVAIPMVPSELAAPVLHGLLTDATVGELVWGGKGVGSQGDGCAQFVARSAEAAEALVTYVGETYPSMSGLVLCLEAE